MFNLAIDSKLRGCDLVALKVEDVAPSGYAVDRATVRQKKTGHPKAGCTFNMAQRLGKHPMQTSCPHKVTQSPLMGPASENRLILANMAISDNIARSVRRGQDQRRPYGANPRAADQGSTALRIGAR
jgi:hypothetical protein